MIDWLIDKSVRHRIFVILAAATAAVAGVFAALRTPMDAVPDLSENQVIVFAEWPGHGPSEVYEHVTFPLSQQLQGLEGVRVVRGSSDIGYSMLHVIFEDRVAFDVARERVQQRTASPDIDLPDGVTPQLAADGIPTGQIYWYTVEGKGYDLAQLRALQDWTIAPQLRSIAGVAEVASVGGFVAELIIQAEPSLLAEHGLTVRDLANELSLATSSVGGNVLHKGNAEYVVQLQPAPVDVDSEGRQSGLPEQWKQRLIPLSDGRSVPLGDVSKIAWGPAARRGMFEKDGTETVAGIVHLRYGHNTLEVTRAVKSQLMNLSAGLPPGVRVVPCYDRTPLITGAVRTVTRTLIEALLIAAVCVLLVLRHFRAWLVIALTLPLCVFGTFLMMSVLRSIGWLDVQTNIMSLAGIVISIGVLVDSSIVMTENVMHQLRKRFQNEPVRGDIRDIVVSACQTVGRPVFGSILVMLVSFVPVFALGGIDGRMYSPLAWTKSLALIAAALLAVTLVPALCTVLVRGRMRDETDSSIVRVVISVYRPMLSYLLDRPSSLVYLLCLTVVLAVIPLGNTFVFQAVMFGSLVLTVLIMSSSRSRVIGAAGLIITGLVGRQFMTPIGTELRLPLDEGIVMDMPITIPRASIAQSGDDLKARNMMLCRFPEVLMVTGKAGRADTPFDPAPLDMIESMIEFRAKEFWPKRRIELATAERVSDRYIDGLTESNLIEHVPEQIRHEIVDAALLRFDTVQRETTWQLTEVFQQQLRRELSRHLIELVGQSEHRAEPRRKPLNAAEAEAVWNQIPAEYSRDLASAPVDATVAAMVVQIHSILRTQRELAGDIAGAAHSAGNGPAEPSFVQSVAALHDRRWNEHVSHLNRTLHERAVPTWLHLVRDECLARSNILDSDLIAVQEQIRQTRNSPPVIHAEKEHHGLAPTAPLPFIDPHPQIDALRRAVNEEFTGSVVLVPHDADSLSGFGGEMDRVLQMPGWTNVWTRPIQNRVDMLATGVNTEVGVRVLGRNLDDVVETSEQIAAVLAEVPGAADVIADPVRGKGLIQITPDPQRAAELGVVLTDLQATLEAALSGRVVTQVIDGPERRAVRLRIAPQSAEDDEETLRRLPIPCRSKTGATTSSGSLATVPLESVADVVVTEGPATIKSENGWLRNYVRMNVRDRSPFDVVADARRVIAGSVVMPPGVFIEWTGQFEHAAETRRTLFILIPCVLILIFAILYVTYADFGDAGLMLLSAPGALAGGVLCQWLLGYPFSIAVGVGYIACFGMAAATGIVMLVYLREAVELAGGLKNMTLTQLRKAVLDGAVHRLRPKLLTEATTVLSLAPMLWSDGVGAEVIRPMAAPVLGGILVADEVIDLLLPILFYHSRRWRWNRLHRLQIVLSPESNGEASATT